MIGGKPETVEQERSCPAASDLQGEVTRGDFTLLLMGHALSYAACGFNVFPIKPNAKTPLTSHGLKDATTDAGTIAAWWSRWPDANIGVATGRASDFAVLDLDGREGEHSLTHLDGELVPTWTALTGNGAHLWFTYPDHELRNSAGKIGKGIDVRGEGGYVIAPPSVHPNGAVYQWVGAKRKRAAWPDWLRPPENERLRTTQSPRTYPAGVTPRTDRYVRVAFEGEARTLLATPEGQRNEQLNRSVHAVARLEALPTAEIAAAFTAIALRIGLEPTETERTIASALKARGR